MLLTAVLFVCGYVGFSSCYWRRVSVSYLFSHHQPAAEHRDGELTSLFAQLSANWWGGLTQEGAPPDEEQVTHYSSIFSILQTTFLYFSNGLKGYAITQTPCSLFLAQNNNSSMFPLSFMSLFLLLSYRVGCTFTSPV